MQLMIQGVDNVAFRREQEKGCTRSRGWRMCCRKGCLNLVDFLYLCCPGSTGQKGVDRSAG